MPRRVLCACTKCAPWLGVPTAIWMSAVWTQWVRSGNAVTAQWGLLGRHEDAVRTQWGRIWSPQERRHILQWYGNAMKGLKKHWQISEFQFPKPYFQPFCSVKYRNQANTTYVSVVLCLRCLLHHILSLIAYTFRENRVFVFISIVQFMMSSNIIRLFVHNTVSLSSLCKLIWRHWTYKIPVRYILSSVWD